MDEETKEVQETKKSNKIGFNITSMILGIISILIGCFIPILPLVASIVSIIFGIIGIKDSGKGMGIAGIICSSIAIIMNACILPIYFYMMSM